MAVSGVRVRVRELLDRLRRGAAYGLPLADDPSSRFLLWITLLMCYLSGLALAGAIAASDMAMRWDTGLAGGLTVQIAAALPGGTVAPPLAERTQAALEILRGVPGIRSARALDAAQLSQLLEPWLGAGAAYDSALPVPALIDVVTDGPVDVPALTRHLQARVPGLGVDDHGVWLADLTRFTGAVQLAALGVVLLVIGVGMMAVVFSVRASLAIHAGVVQLLHLMGAADRYIAHQFETHVVTRVLKGGISGMVLAVATLLALDHAVGGLRASLLPSLTFNIAEWLIVGVVPFAVAAVAWAVTRFTVMRRLELMP